VTPPGNQAENCENKPQPGASEETGLLDKALFPGRGRANVFTIGKHEIGLLDIVILDAIA